MARPTKLLHHEYCFACVTSECEASIPFTRCRCLLQRDMPILYTVHGLIMSMFYYYRPTYFTAIYIQVNGILKYRRHVS